jgi:hypothetical protein
MKKIYILLVMVILIAGCNNNKNKPTEKPLNIIVAIDFDNSRLENDVFVRHDTAIINCIFDYFRKIQKEKKFESADKIIIIPLNAMENNTALLLEMNKLQGNDGGFYGLESKVEKINNAIREMYKNSKNKNINTDFYRFFRDELTRYIVDGYSNKLVIISNGNSIIKDDILTTNIKTFITKKEYLQVLSDKDWETKGLLQNIELSPIYVKNISNLDVFMPELSPNEFDNYINESSLLKTIWENWFSKIGFNYYIMLASNDLLSYKGEIEKFLKQNSVQEDVVLVKNRSNKYVEYLNLENKELVRGSVGNYYVVDIRSAETNHLITFNSGKYFIDSFAKEYDLPLLEFKSNIIDIISHSGYSTNKFRIFIKGSADIKGAIQIVAPVKPPL